MTMNMARTRKQKRDANKRYHELNRKVKRRCRRDRRQEFAMLETNMAIYSINNQDQTESL